MRVLKFAVDHPGYSREATDYRPLPADWDELDADEQHDYVIGMERHLNHCSKSRIWFDGIVEAPAEELTPAEVADLYGVTVSTIRRWAATGRLKAKDGSPPTFRRDDLFPHLAAKAPGAGS